MVVAWVINLLGRSALDIAVVVVMQNEYGILIWVMNIN